ncbi:hypothetical protein R3P38DRAFT_3298109 [Favolaschia claudopus]|uniref:Secreted protein n=1 Tax=Favolaschia claudopus TaxID=2862362 RepID=A0AAV9Z4A5_9AGAR
MSWRQMTALLMVRAPSISARDVRSMVDVCPATLISLLVLSPHHLCARRPSLASPPPTAATSSSKIASRNLNMLCHAKTGSQRPFSLRFKDQFPLLQVFYRQASSSSPSHNSSWVYRRNKLLSRRASKPIKSSHRLKVCHRKPIRRVKTPLAPAIDRLQQHRHRNSTRSFVKIELSSIQHLQRWRHWRMDRQSVRLQDITPDLTYRQPLKTINLHSRLLRAMFVSSPLQIYWNICRVNRLHDLSR